MKVVDLAEKNNNVSYLNEVLNEQILHARLYGGYFSVALIDIHLPTEKTVNMLSQQDNSINDELNTWLRANVRKNEYSVRYKEGKYILIFNSIRNINQLSSAIERIYHGMMSEKISGLENSDGSVKIGISVFPFDGETPDILIKKAEEAGKRLKSEERLFYGFYNDCIVML